MQQYIGTTQLTVGGRIGMVLFIGSPLATLGLYGAHLESLASALRIGLRTPNFPIGIYVVLTGLFLAGFVLILVGRQITYTVATDANETIETKPSGPATGYSWKARD